MATATVIPQGCARLGAGRRPEFEPTEQRLRHARERTLAQCQALQRGRRTRMVFGGATALRLAGVDVLSALEESPGAQRPVVVARRRGARCQVAGIRGAMWSYLMRICEMDGVFFVDPATAWMMSAPHLDVDALVAQGDALLRRSASQRVLTLEQLDAFVEAVRRDAASRGMRLPAGFANCRTALRFMREGTDSFPETRLRLLLVRHGLPCPVVNRRVFLSGYEFYLDMSYDTGLAVEYDGAQHAFQRSADRERAGILADAGWERIVVTHADITDPALRRALLGDVAARLSRRSGVAIRPLGAPVPLRALADRRRSASVRSLERTESGMRV